MKNVLILSCSTGQGHNSCAKAVKESFDKKNVEAELAVIGSIVQEYGASFNIGLFGDETEAKYQEFVGKLEEAGLSKVMEECRVQYEAFCERKGQE